MKSLWCITEFEEGRVSALTLDLTGANGCATLELLAVCVIANLLYRIVPGRLTTGAEDYPILLRGINQ